METYRLWPWPCAARKGAGRRSPYDLLPLLLGLPLAFQAAPAPGQATRTASPPTTRRAQPTTRDARRVMEEFRAAGEELRMVMPSSGVLSDEERRAKIAPQAVPALRKMLAAMEELGSTQPAAGASPVQARYQLLAILSTLGDVPAAAVLKSAAEGQNTADAVAARSAQVLVNWWRAGTNAAAQGKVLDEMQALAKAHPDNDMITTTLKLISEHGAASQDLQQRVWSIITQDLKGPGAQRLTRQLHAEQKRQAILDKPLNLTGATVQGATLSTATWGGKVVLVHFWATWCTPALEDLPRLKQVYADYHAKGLEILGVSCDNSAEDLRTFLQQNPDMSWPELFDPAANPAQRWHPLAGQCGVTALPTFFLIDKKGILRSIDARDDFEQLIPRLLLESGQGTGDRGQ